MSWYSNMDPDVTIAARELAGNWRRFQCFVWQGRPEHRPEDCAILYLENRDSDCLEQSNAAAVYAALAPCLGDLNDGEMAETCSHSHWAVGHVDGVVIRCVDEHGAPTWAFQKLHELACELDNYPVLDEDDLSEREIAAADLTWKNCYTDRERAKYLRAHPPDHRFDSLADLMACVRGAYYPGYPSDMGV